MTHPWPLFDLRVRTPRLELRLPTDDDLLGLLDVAKAGIHDPDEMPFAFAWTDQTGTQFERGFLAFDWRARASVEPDDWSLPLAVVVEGRPVGLQELRTTRFPVLRTVETGSWLGRAWQGRGIGTEMRAAGLVLAFDGLGAARALSAAHDGNDASRRVSEKLGYAPNGVSYNAPRGEPIRQTHYLLERDAFDRSAWDVTLEGVEPCLEMLGAG
jgi:RimJ/RimL family protein N-acetyltransferase